MSTPNLNVDDEQIIAATRNWLEKAVIGLNLCPFAKAVHTKQQIRSRLQGILENPTIAQLFMQPETTVADRAAVDSSIHDLARWLKADQVALPRAARAEP